MAKVDIFQSRSKNTPFLTLYRLCLSSYPGHLGLIVTHQEVEGPCYMLVIFLEEKLCLRSLRLWGEIFIFDPLFSLGQKLKIQKVNFF